MVKKSLIALCFMFVLLFAICSCYASSTVNITMNDEEILINGGNTFNEDVYLSSGMNNGGESDEAKSANINVENIINIKNSGIFEFSGTLSDGQIAVDTNGVDGDIVILLNNVNLTCKNAPAIFVYNIATKSDTCNVIIKTAKDSYNYVSGGLIKQSVEGWTDQDKIVYSIEKNYNDEGVYFERYKYDGAISSDISLTFEGDGTLEIESQREGIEGKRDITFNSGTYIINSTEDGINAAQDNESIITINGGKIVVNTSKDGPQGDGIDSNGYLYINGGEVYAFANPDTEDSGLDSDLGIYINGGTVVATGNMYDEIKNASKQKNVTYQFENQVPEGTLIALVDENDNAVVAFETDRTYKVITFSSQDLEDKEYIVYEGGKIDGDNINGLYSNITSYEKGMKINARKLTDNDGKRPFDKNFDKNFINSSESKFDTKTLVLMAVSIIILLIIAIVLIVNKKYASIVLILGILVGIIGTSICNLVIDYNKNEMTVRDFEDFPKQNFDMKNNMRNNIEK